jgi:hypothetical protein
MVQAAQCRWHAGFLPFFVVFIAINICCHGGSVTRAAIINGQH